MKSMKFLGKVIFGGKANAATSFTQASHGLAVGDVVRLNSTNYVKAQADTVTNAEVAGVVETVDGNDFTVAFPGAVVHGLSGLTAGGVYFLSTSTAGLAVTSDAADGYVSKPVWVALTSTSAMVLNSRGVYKVAGTDPTTDIYNEAVGVGTVDGATTTFTLAQTPVTNSLRLVMNGVLRKVNIDYTLDGVTIVFTTPPPVDSLILASYEID